MIRWDEVYMFKKFLAKLGKGSAQVDLVLKNNQFQSGDLIEGELIVQGGTVEQEINKIEVDLYLYVRVKTQEYTYKILSIPFLQPFKIQPSERKSLPVQAHLPDNLPLSSYTVHYFFVTNLDIAGGVDSSDRDYIEVVPPHRLNQLLAAFDQLGFREKQDSRSFNGYTQEFEFFPTTFLHGRVEEVEFVVAFEPDQLRLLVEVDKYSFFGEKEIKREITISNDLLNDLPALTNYLQQVLQEIVENPDAFSYPYSMYGTGHSHHYHHAHRHSNFAGALGGFAAGVVGGMILADILNDDDEETEEDGGLFAEEDNGEESGGFFDDLFGGDEEDV